MNRIAFFLFCAAIAAHAQTYTRGIGVYPGDPKEYTGPTLVADANTDRNLALHRPAYQSSAYDYNLTAQLITDGIKATEMPQWIETSTSVAGTLPKREREVFLDGNVTSSVNVSGDAPWVEFDIAGGGKAPEIDRIDLYLRKIYGRSLAGITWTYTVAGSDDRITWKEVGRASGSAWPDMRTPGPSFMESIAFAAPARFRSYRVQLSAPNIRSWGVAELALFDRGKPVRVAGPDLFTSAWMSAGSGEEWVYVDLGAGCAFDRVALSWIQRPADGAIQISDDASAWKTIEALGPSSRASDDIHLAQSARGRYVRVLMSKPQRPGDRYILSELEVYGRGGFVVMPRAAAAADKNGILPLAGGKWRLQRASLVSASGEQLSTPGFSDMDWMVATVPGTVLTSYLNDGAIPDPDFGDNQYAVSDSFFCADFWYRDEFNAPAIHPGDHTWLNFDGINWKAEVYLNGHKVGRIDGGFMRGRFDVTKLVNRSGPNALAVRIIRVANPGSAKDKAGPTVNGGALGRDNPTFHASAGWDWMSTIRGRDTGIWNNVTLTTCGPVRIEDPLVTTRLPLPDTTHADVAIQATLRNLETKPVSGTLRAGFGGIQVEAPVMIEAGASRTVKLSPETQSALRLAHPRLWWPVGYGEPYMYPVSISFVVDGVVSDETSFKAGVRQFTYSEDGGVLKIWINGRRFIARGGNWGFSESMLRYRSREYDAALRYHRDENFNMIRNWVGQTGDEAFYDAADRFGVVVWQDFWLANPWDGPDPDDDDLFLANAKDYLLRIRNHASLGIFCGRNEGLPPEKIDNGLRRFMAELEPDSHYISSSADGPVSGHGPYRVEPLRYYFEHAPAKLHSEMGSPNVVEMDNLRRTMPESAMWPQSYQWPLHDYHEQNPFTAAVNQEFGGASNIADWENFAQFVDYDAYRGMFEGQSKNRLGLLIWMSHPAWPSLLWQTYDYFFDTDAGYYGAKKGAEPLHIQWNASTDAVEVVNYSAGEQAGLAAHAEVIDIDGEVRWEKSATLESHEDSTVSPIQLEFPSGLSRTHFIRLTLKREGKVVSTNFYLRGVKEGDYQEIRELKAAKITAKTHVKQNRAGWRISTELHNISKTPALMVRVKAVRSKSGDLSVPALFSDNYVALMPGEKKTIAISLQDADTRGERPAVRLEGFNLEGAGPR